MGFVFISAIISAEIHCAFFVAVFASHVRPSSKRYLSSMILSLISFSYHTFGVSAFFASVLHKDFVNTYLQESIKILKVSQEHVYRNVIIE